MYGGKMVQEMRIIESVLPGWGSEGWRGWVASVHMVSLGTRDNITARYLIPGPWSRPCGSPPPP